MPNYRPLSIQQIFQNLEGIWSFQRTLDKQGTMKGIASFSPLHSSSSYYYEEKGKVQLLNACLNAHRNYVYSFQNGTIALFFANPHTKQPTKLLYQLDFHSIPTFNYPLQASGTYLCQADTYKSYYQFLDWRTLQLSYQVRGPHKNWLITTHFAKIAHP